MKHYEPGKPYPRKRTDSGPAVRRHSAAAYARREMRRKQIRRNRILFGVLLVILAGLIFAAVHLTLKDKGRFLFPKQCLVGCFLAAGQPAGQ